MQSKFSLSLLCLSVLASALFAENNTTSLNSTDGGGGIK